MMDKSNHAQREAILLVVAMIPRGQVATYGQVAKLAGLPNYARYVGTTLKRLPGGSQIPWHRVINAQGKIAFQPGSAQYIEQQRRLQKDKVPVVDGKVNLRKYGFTVE